MQFDAAYPYRRVNGADRLAREVYFRSFENMAIIFFNPLKGEGHEFFFNPLKGEGRRAPRRACTPL